MASLILYMVVCSFTPGPGNILALKATTSYGWKGSWKMLIGICTGYGVVQTICSVALYQVNSLSEEILHVISIVGAIYMMWLAVHIIMSKPDSNLQQRKPLFTEGMVLQLVNVKIYFYIITLLSKYFIPQSDSILELVLYGAFAVSIGSIACFVWAFAGVVIQRYYEKHFRAINVVLGLTLMYCAIEMIIS